jgi:murein DD-endopeptidase MepM/ murein hydrolase activator NlpD
VRKAFLRLLLLAAAGLTLVLLANARRSEAAPSFVWPWAGIEGWRYTQGFHLDHALDFQPQIAPNCGDPVDLTHTIRPAAPGTVTAIRYRGPPEPPLPVSLTIDHGAGWTSYYTHLANVPDAVATIGAQVDYETDLGNPSCYSACNPGVGPPCATGRHVHFQLLKDGSGAGIMQTTICGWTVGEDGGISRDGQTYYASLSAAAPIANTGCAATAPETPAPTGTSTATPAATATATSTPTDTPTPTPADTPTPSPTPTPSWLLGDAGCDGVTNAVDALLVLQYSAGYPPSWCTGRGDANRDGAVDPIDATLILQYAAGLIPGLPA